MARRVFLGPRARGVWRGQAAEAAGGSPRPSGPSRAPPTGTAPPPPRLRRRGRCPAPAKGDSGGGGRGPWSRAGPLTAPFVILKGASQSCRAGSRMTEPASPLLRAGRSNRDHPGCPERARQGGGAAGGGQGGGQRGIAGAAPRLAADQDSMTWPSGSALSVFQACISDDGHARHRRPQGWLRPRTDRPDATFLNGILESQCRCMRHCATCQF